MSRISHQALPYRHVVFPDALNGGGKPINFTPEHLEISLPTPLASELTSDEQQAIAWLFRHAGLRLSDYRIETIRRRLPACLRAMRLTSVEQIPAAVRQSQDLLKTAINTLLIGVTSFFRDPDVFDVLATSVLPQLLAQSPRVRIWSIGCSDGAELYSIAMLLAERAAVQRCTLLGTDCRSEAIARGREGCYDLAALKSVPTDLRVRYFNTDGIVWRIHPFLRAVVQWRTGDVLQTPEPGLWDLILCRNMAIYMQPESTAQLWAALTQRLRRGGILVLGKAERPFGIAGLRPISSCIYRRDRS